MFYIQRNQNTNTVVYDVNLGEKDIININEPILINWIKFDRHGNQETQELNYIQKKLAYGYTFNVISNDLIEFSFVSYEKMKFYLFKSLGKSFKVAAILDGVNTIIDRIYIYAEDLGVFPQVKYAEFFGRNQMTNKATYKKLFLQK